MTTGCLGERSLIAAANSSPFIAGMAKSVMTTSNLPLSNMARASLPLLAVSTTWPSKLSIILTASQTKGSSSTTRIRRLGKAGGAFGITVGTLSEFGRIASNCLGAVVIASHTRTTKPLIEVVQQQRRVDYIYPKV